MRLLIVDDDHHLVQSLIKVLVQHNYVVDIANDGKSGWALATAYNYDLIILDIIMPLIDGISLCQKLRQQGSQMPILLLTGCDTQLNKVSGLDAGADDYIVKPFSWEEFLARVRALLRRRDGKSSPTFLEWGDLRLNLINCQVTWQQEKLLLRPKEYALLELFLRNLNRVFSCSAILDHLWSCEDSPGEETVRAHIKGLRQKLNSVGIKDAIETVYGLGYRWKPIEESESMVVPVTAELGQANCAITLKEMLADSWKQIKPAVLEQVACLAQATTCLDGELQEKAIGSAHQLAGLVGAFGFHQGTKLSREIEALLQNKALKDSKKKLYLQNAIAALHRELSGGFDRDLENI